MKVLLIVPTALDGRGRPIRQRRLHLPSLTLSMLAAVTPPDVSLRLVYETVEDIPFDEPWDLVGLSSMGSGVIRAWQIADVFRKKGVKVVLGGVSASLADEAWMLEHADALVKGEAEELWPQVLDDLKAGRLQPVYRMTKRPPIDRLPVPRYDLMTGSRFGIWRPVQATRGCPFTCNFCSVTAFFEQSYRKRPVDQVIRDVRAAKASGFRHIAFIDDNIGVDFEYSAALWEALIPEKVTWMSQCSLHIAERPDMLTLAYKSGCRLLSFGIETTNPQSLDAVNKAWNRPERYTEAIETIRAHGVDVSSEMMIGLDGDDASVFDDSYDFVMENAISVPRVHILTPVPGTPLFDQLMQQGRILSTDFNKYTGGHVVFKPMRIEPDVLQRGYWNLYERLFRWKSILHRIGRNRAALGPIMRGVVWAVNLHYRQHIRHRITPGIV